MCSILTTWDKINKNLISIVKDYLLPIKEFQILKQKVLFDHPSLTASFNRYSSIKSQALQFRLRNYATYCNTVNHLSNKSICIMSFHIYTSDYNFFLPEEVSDLIFYVKSYTSNNGNFFIYFYVPKIDVLKGY